MVATVVVTFNRLPMLKDLIESLRHQENVEHKIIVVNNGSTDGTTEWLAEQSDIDVVTQGNVGGAGGFFTGIKYAVEKGYDYVWIMDDDVLCRPDALSELMTAIRVKERVGYVCSRVVGESGVAMNTPGADCRASGPNYPDTYDLVTSHGMVKVSGATFVSVLLPSKMVRERGLPLRQFFIWGDDTEFTMRLSAVAPCYIACRSVVVHRRANQGRLSFMDEKDPRRLVNYRYLFRNKYVYLRRWEGVGAAVKSYACDSIAMLKLLIRFDFRHLAPMLRGVWGSLWFHPKVEWVEENKC